jgi:Pyridoxamine 5'-phosphate oxidase
MTWTEFERHRPALAAEGRRQFYQWDIGLGFLATVRADGGPRLHPVCPVIGPAGLHVLVVPGPKQADLRRDGRYALHSDTCPPPRQEDGFSVTGRAREVTDPAVRRAVRDDALFELGVDRCLLMLTQAADAFPRGPTIWRARP